MAKHTRRTESPASGARPKITAGAKGRGSGKVGMAKDQERYLVQALEFESVLRACLYRYARNNSDVEELLQETYARLLRSEGVV